MSSQEKMELPEPLKINKNILKQLDDLEKNGDTINAFIGELAVETIFQLYLIKKYKSKCVVEHKDLKFGERPLGITINLKLKYTSAEENIMKEEFTKFSKKITECVEKGEKIIIIPLGYIRGKGGHANILIYRRDSNVIEHFEPHGGEYIDNTKLQDSVKKIMLFFTSILNLEFKKKGIPSANYIEASQVCPYIKGLQTLEGASKLKKNAIEGGGYCAAWSMFFAEVCLKNPNMSSPEVLENIYNYLTTKASSHDYLRKVIRGYAGYFVETVNKYLEIFFKPKITIADIIDIRKKYLLNNNINKLKTLEDAMTVLVNIESEALLDENFDFKKELKKTMKEYRNITKGMTKEQQSRNRALNKEMRFLYFRKRILQNYEEYNKHGKITEPLIDSPFEIKRETMINPDIIKKGRNAKEEDPEYMKFEKLRKMREEEKKARAEQKKENKKRAEEYFKKNEEMRKIEEDKKIGERKPQTEKKKSSPNSKTKKVKINVIPENMKKELEKALGKDKAKMVEQIIKEKKLDMTTKEGKDELIKIILEMGKK